MDEVARSMPRTSAQVALYVEALGARTAVLFLLRFGGTELSLAQDPKGQGMVERFLGYEKARALAQHPTLTRQKRIPWAKRWLSEMLASHSCSTAEITHQQRTSDTVERPWLKETSR